MQIIILAVRSKHVNEMAKQCKMTFKFPCEVKFHHSRLSSSIVNYRYELIKSERINTLKPVNRALVQ